MSCRHDLANGTCAACYPGTGTVRPEHFAPNMDGPGAAAPGPREVAAAQERTGTAATPTICVASRVRHAGTWRALRWRGWPITSTWIDAQLPDVLPAALWDRLLQEVASASVLLALGDPEVPVFGPGTEVEVGAALHAGKRVVAVVPPGFTGPSWLGHRLVSRVTTLAAAADEGLVEDRRAATTVKRR